MHTQKLGNSRLSVTPIGLGLAALGRPGYINLGHADDLSQNYNVATMEAQAHLMLDAAWEAGIRYFDAARSYGMAENFLSSWLATRHIEKDAVTIGSKWGYTYTADWQVSLPTGQKHEVKAHSLAVLQRQHQESQTLLGDQLDLYQIHSATLDSAVLTNQAVLQKLAQLRNEGLEIGLSVSGLQQSDTIWAALEIVFDGAPLFTTVQATWNLLEQSATVALQAAHDAGMGVIIKEALANGRLTSRNNDPDFQIQMSLLNAQSKATNTTIDGLALAAVINQPFVDVALSGAVQVTHLQSNLLALQISADESVASLQEQLVEPANTYWHKRSQLTWN